MEPIYTSITEAPERSIEADLQHRAMMIEAGTVVSQNHALQYALQFTYHTQAEKLLNLAVTNKDMNPEGSGPFLLAHNNVQARMDTIKTIWSWGLNKEAAIEDYQEALTRSKQPQDQE